MVGGPVDDSLRFCTPYLAPDMSRRDTRRRPFDHPDAILDVEVRVLAGRTADTDALDARCERFPKSPLMTVKRRRRREVGRPVLDVRGVLEVRVEREYPPRSLSVLRSTDGEGGAREQQNDTDNGKARQTGGYPQSHVPAVGRKRLDLNPQPG